MQFIDINTILGEWTFKKFYLQTVEDLKKEMNRLGIIQSYVIDTKAWLSELSVGNEATFSLAKNEDMITPVMVMTPLIDREHGGKDHVIEQICKNRVGAVRLFPQDHKFTLHPWNIDKLFTIMSDLKMPVFIDRMELSGDFDEYDQLYHLCREYPDVPIVLMTPGYRTARMIYPILEKCKNFHIDTSLLIACSVIEEVVQEVGSEHILFGSRCPYLEPGTFVGRVLYADISTQDKEKIAHQNIEQLHQQIQYPY